MIEIPSKEAPRKSYSVLSTTTGVISIPYCCVNWDLASGSNLLPLSIASLDLFSSIKPTFLCQHLYAVVQGLFPIMEEQSVAVMTVFLQDSHSCEPCSNSITFIMPPLFLDLSNT